MFAAGFFCFLIRDWLEIFGRTRWCSSSPHLGHGVLCFRHPLLQVITSTVNKQDTRKNHQQKSFNVGLWLVISVLTNKLFGGVPYTNQNPTLLPSSHISAAKGKTRLASNPLRLEFHTPQTQEPNLPQTLRKKRWKKNTTPNFHQPNHPSPPPPKKKKQRISKWHSTCAFSKENPSIISSAFPAPSSNSQAVNAAALAKPTTASWPWALDNSSAASATFGKTDGIFFWLLGGWIWWSIWYLFIYIYIHSHIHIHTCSCIYVYSYIKSYAHMNMYIWSWRSVVGVFHDILIYVDGACVVFARQVGWPKSGSGWMGLFFLPILNAYRRANLLRWFLWYIWWTNSNQVWIEDGENNR